jgi:hypothetical protein
VLLFWFCFVFAFAIFHSRADCCHISTAMSLTITQGACRLLTSLVDAGMLENVLLDVLSKRVQIPAFVMFQGLSFGGALAQGATVLFAEYLERLNIPSNQVHLGLVVFGAPRIGDKNFFDIFNTFRQNMQSGFGEELLPPRIAGADHFIMYSHNERNSVNLHH